LRTLPCSSEPRRAGTRIYGNFIFIGKDSLARQNFKIGDNSAATDRKIGRANAAFMMFLHELLNYAIF
jgi:hypothetical protein